MAVSPITRSMRAATCSSAPPCSKGFQAFWASTACVESATSYHACSAAPLPWPSAFSWAAPFFKAGRSLLAFGSNFAVKRTASPPLTLAVIQRGSQQMSDAEWSVADAAVKGVITVVFLYLVFAVCRWVWRTLIRGVRAAQRHAPTALENTAKVAGKATKEASTLASKLKKAFDEGRK